MGHLRRLFAATLLCVGAAGSLGCEVIAGADRDKIPLESASSAGGGGGQGGAGGQGLGGAGGQGVGGAGGQGGAGGAASDCGDGSLGGSELCDDGNTTAGDGCAADCTVETGYSCDGSPSACLTTCGDSIAAGTEECDDGNPDETDGCLTTCAVASCGDGFVRQGFEQCDDANPNDTDGCLSSCAVAKCGDGVTQAGVEACDDGNTSNVDGCLNTCLAASCGDGIVQAGVETCDDGNPSNTDGCLTTCAIAKCGDGFTQSGVEACDDGNPSNTDGCLTTCAVAKCGDGFMQAGVEACDDANPDNTDGCLTTCLAASCGDGFTQAGVEACDDANPDNTDGCLTTCAVAKCGDGFTQAGVEACDDANPDNTDGCLDTCAVAKCGDGFTQAGVEACDDANPSNTDGCLTTCATASCGDGFTHTGVEDCDDGNAASLDGCSASCLVDILNEAEPNGTIAEADGPFTPDVLLKGSIMPIGDVDLFAITLPATADLKLETFDTSGPGACANIDTLITLLASDGTTVLASDDDAGIGACSRVDSASVAAARHLPAGTYYVRVEELGNDKLVPAYSLVVTYNALCGDSETEGSEECDGGAACGATCDRNPTCGDSFLDGSETCDDGNASSGDGCSDACALETIAEMEPNNTSGQATGPYAPTVLFSGAISPAGDVDVYAITLATTSDLKVETFDANGPGSCSGIDTLIRLYAPDGSTLILERDQGGVGNCATIDSTVGIDAAARHLAAGTYYVSVEEYQGNGTIPGYRLLVSLNARCGDGVKQGAEECDGGAACGATCDRIPTCGDGLVDDPEICDDGNTEDGDGCSALCAGELVLEAEPNGLAVNATGPLTPYALAAGSINPASDVDIYQIVVPAVADLRLETFDANGPGSCENGIDTFLTLLGTNGTTQLAQQDDRGINLCSRISSAIDVGARHIQPGVYFAVVESYQYMTVIPAYRLEVKFDALCGDGVRQGFEECDGTPGCDANCDRIAVCGDGYVDGLETCDDGNKIAADGCSSICQIEAIFEVEPNGSTADADARALDPFPILFNDSAIVKGSIGAVGDKDVFKVTLSSAGVVRLETFDSTFAGCSITTTIRVLDPLGNPLITDDVSGIGGCSALVLNAPAGTYYVQVEEQGNDATLSGYYLQLKRQADVGAEVEPNETPDGSTSLAGSDVFILGDHTANADSDVYAITVPPGRSLRVELIEGGAEACESGGVDSLLTLYDGSGVALGEDDDAGRGFCSLIDGTGSAPVNAFASRLDGGTYYLQVQATPLAQVPGDLTGQFAYRLVVTAR